MTYNANVMQIICNADICNYYNAHVKQIILMHEIKSDSNIELTSRQH